MLFTRKIEEYLKEIEQKYRCITLVGPRQSGKTTLARKFFKRFEYLSLENPDIALQARQDPRGFFGGIRSHVIIDEIQKVPELLSYLQEILDDQNDERRFVLTGSNNLKLHAQISQSLAGRTRILTILPFHQSELPMQANSDFFTKSCFQGGYPKIFQQSLNPTEWLSDYYQTYIEKDVRQVLNVGDLPSFDRFVRLCAGRIGQLVNFESLGNDAGVSQPTAKAWVGALETTFVCFRLEPHFKNFNKRLIKSPKLYFYDTGLLCYLLRVTTQEQIVQHPLRGMIFENFIISEIFKYFYNRGQEAPLYFWRDQHGHEVDLVVDKGVHLDLIEIKSGSTFNKEFIKNIEWLSKLQGDSINRCIYTGSRKTTFNGISILPWHELGNEVF